MNSSFPQLAVFDLAGTTVLDDRYVHKVLQKSMADYGIAISLDEANEVMGIPKPIAMRQLLEQHHRVPDPQLIADMHRDFVKNMTRFYQEEPAVREIDGASQVFRALIDRGVKIVVDTGFDRAITDPLLARMNWNGLIHGSVTSDEVPHGRPHPDLIFRAMQLTGVTDAARVMKVGDTPSDLQEGTAAKCGWVVGIVGNFSREQLTKEPHTYIVDRLTDVPALVS
jgi:phosphonatase-like hydrolase